MSTSPKLHKWKNCRPNNTVSADSLLGMLSSVYGTEELDSTTLFDDSNSIVNWKCISVENIRAQGKREDIETSDKNVKYKGLKKMNVSTSTSSLKLQRKTETENEIDLTLVSIKSLDNLKESDNILTRHIDDSTSKNLFNESKLQLAENLSRDNISSSLSIPEIDVIPHQDGSTLNNDTKPDMEVSEDLQQLAVYGFYVDSSNQELLFDIKFLNKIKNKDIFDIGEEDIPIYVSDLAKQTTTCVTVPKSCMILKSQYFAEVEKKIGLDNLEVFIKTNINIFLWVIKWIKTDMSMLKPKICASILNSILLIAYHLRIDSLVEECLDFFHHNLRGVLKIDHRIEDLFGNDLMLQFVKRFCNSEVNEIGDDFESFSEKMFCALITLLVDQDLCFDVGHYSSLATLFQCGFCKKLINHSLISMVPCTTDHNKLDVKGKLVYSHEVSPSWSLSKYIQILFESLQNWKLVYWYLWGVCHFLYCAECGAPYPTCQSEWCPYHPEVVEYFPLNSNLHYPIGTYTCCGEKAFRFNVLQPYSGCKFKSHTPDLSLIENRAVHTIYVTNKHLICCKPPEITVKSFVKLMKKTENDILNPKIDERFWWDGLLLAPREKKDYSIIPTDILNLLRGKHSPKKIPPKVAPLTLTEQVHLGMMPSHLTFFGENLKNCEQICPEAGYNNKLKVKDSNLILANVPFSKNKIKRKKFNMNEQTNESIWSSSQTIKNNQDNLRDFEEQAMRRLVKMLPHVPADLTSEPSAGSYIRLEAYWWQEHCVGTGSAAKHSGTVINRTFPLSWFRRNHL